MGVLRVIRSVASGWERECIVTRTRRVVDRQSKQATAPANMLAECTLTPTHPPWCKYGAWACQHGARGGVGSARTRSPRTDSKDGKGGDSVSEGVRAMCARWQDLAATLNKYYYTILASPTNKSMVADVAHAIPWQETHESVGRMKWRPSRQRLKRTERPSLSWP